jgi:hypothetical protein
MDDDPTLFEPSTNPLNAARWVALTPTLSVTASGAPGKARFARWRDRGVTDVVTLQRADEMPAWLPRACEDAGVSWRAFALSGKRLAGEGDAASIAALVAWADGLVGEEEARRVVVHCSAGLHRTGLGLYLMARRAGHAPDEAAGLVARARGLTGAELVRAPRSGDALAATAEAALAQLG